jgi:WD40 repeat protein
VVRFARDLRLLREKAGSPTYRELGARAHYSAASLTDAAGGRRLPSLPVTLAYVGACGGDVAEWKTRWHETAAELAVTKEPNDDKLAPYVGLSAFQQEDAERFFGREELVADLLSRLGERRFLGVFGASGSGKSSLLRAGLAANITKTRGQGSPPVVVFTPGQHPLEECAVHLARFLGESPGTLLAEFAEQPRNLHLRIRQALAGDTTDTDAVLVVDQFEEVFTLCGDGQERAAFVDALVFAATDPASRTRIVLGVRADFLGHCSHHPNLVDALRDAQVLVGGMSPDELRRAITGPAEQAGYRVETALVARLVADATRQPGILPLVSHALLQTWLRRRGKVMTVAGYEAAGSIEHALASSAETVHQTLDERQQDITKQIFLRLTVSGDGTEDTRRRVAVTELGQDDPNTALVLDTLTSARLITRGQDTVELAHEALIRHWPRLRDWLAEDREGHRLRRLLTEAAADWLRHDRDVDLLYRGARLAAWQERALDPLNDTERAFLAASRDVVDQALRVRRRRVRWVIGGLSSATVVVTVLAVLATVLAGRADHERALAVARQLVADARAQLQADPELGLLLGREAFARAPNEESESVLRQAATDSHIRATIPAVAVGGEDDFAVSGVAFSPDGTHLAVTDTGASLQVLPAADDYTTRPLVLSGTSSLGKPVFSPDGSHIAMASIAGVAMVRNWADGGVVETLDGEQNEVQVVAFSTDGRRLASGGLDGTIQIRDLTGRERTTVLSGHQGGVLDVAYSPGGRLLASSGEDGAIRVWDVASGRPVTSRSQDGRAPTVAFDASGRVVSADVDGTIRTWDPLDAEDPVVIGIHSGGVERVTAGADGDTIASAGNDGTVRIWNANRNAEPVVLHGHHSAINDLAFSQDGKVVASAGYDGTAKVWDVDEVDHVTVFRGQQVRDTAASTDGRQIASIGLDGAVRLWNVAGGADPMLLLGAGQQAIELTFSRDGRYLAVVYDTVVTVWRTRDPTEPMQLRSPYESAAWAVAFSPDGDRLAAVDLTGAISIWRLPDEGDTEVPTVSQLFADGHDGLSEVAWAPSGRHVAAAGNAEVLIWDLDAGTSPTVLPVPDENVRTLTFSPDGTHLTAAASSGVIRVWDVRDTAAPTVLRGRQGTLWEATYSQDGRYLFVASSDFTVSVLRTDGAGEPLVIDGFRASVYAIAAIANDRYVTTHDDGTIRVWRCRTCGAIADVLDHADRHVTRELTPAERETYL